MSLFMADFVAEIGVQTARDADAIFCSRRFPPAGLCGRLTLYFTDAGNAYAAHKGAIGGGRATNLASLRRFCAIAANVNSNWAPHGPRNRSRPSRRIRFNMHVNQGQCRSRRPARKLVFVISGRL